MISSDKLIKAFTICIQICASLVALFVTYMVFAFFDYQGGIDSFVGMIILQPLLAIIISVFTVFICLLIGLPIRINKKLNKFWREKFYLAPVLALCGIISCALSLLPAFTQEIESIMDGTGQIVTVSNLFLSIIGWFLIAIGFLHWNLPYKIESWLTDWLNRILNFTK